MYCTFATTVHIFSYSILITSLFYNKGHLTLAFCLQEDFSNISWRIFCIGRALANLELSILWILYFAAQCYVRANAHSNKIKCIIGLYQRNVLTLFQTIAVFSFNSLSQTFVRGLIFGLYKFKHLDLKEIRICYMNLNMTICFVLILFQIALIINLTRKIPSLFNAPSSTRINTNNFYVHPPEIVPRRDFHLANIHHQPKRLNNPVPKPPKLIFVKEVFSLS